MSDVCRGLDPDGNPCICMRADETYVDSRDNRTKCRSCDHIVSAHPEPKKPNSVGDYLRSFQAAGQSKPTASRSVSVKASQAEAEAETSAGLKSSKKRKSKGSAEKSDSEAERPRKVSKGKGKDVVGEEIEFGKLVLVPTGVFSDGSLRKTRLPDDATMSAMQKAGLVVLAANPLFKINTLWSRPTLNKNIKSYLPKPITYLEQNPEYSGRSNDSPDVQDQLWMPVTKRHTTLTIGSNPLPTALELADIVKQQHGRPKASRVLYLVSKRKIPSSHWEWDEQPKTDEQDLGPSDEAVDGLASDLDTLPSEGIIPIARKKQAGKQKMLVKKKIKAEEDLGEHETDMRKAAKMRTRISTGALKYNALFIPEEEEVPAGPSGLASHDDVVISDSETPPPAPTLQSTLEVEADPDFVPPSPRSADGDADAPPSFFADLDYSWAFTHPPSFMSTSTTGSGSGTTPSSTHLPTISSDNGAEASSAPEIPHRQVAPAKTGRFIKLGKGRCLGN
ncbi:hypothetical protein R3P38DRAFT_2592028 [Favolaschia claudopus]|uniref:Uncharacterized protein n=1 Tax=Favolaschia claudopus TaxID=2862362 RepID=A0AAV9YY48_9AGAR